MTEKILIGRYEIIKELGQGGAGQVYLAHDRHLKKAVALKRITRSKSASVGGLWHEANVLKQMEDPALPVVYDFFTNADGDYMVMEYVQGVTLADYVSENGPMTVSAAILLIHKLASAIEYLHSFASPVIHGDLKPANIMLRGDGQIKLLDFGTSFMQYGARLRHICSGSRHFSAPEMFTKNAEAGKASDIYSLGAILYYLLSGRVAQPTARGRCHYIMGEANADVKRLISRCLCRDASKRYQNVWQLKDELQSIGRMGRRQRAFNMIKRILRSIILLSLIFAGAVLIWGEQIGEAAPLIIHADGVWRWNGSFQTTFTHAAGACLIFAGIYFILLASGPKSYDIKVVKDVYLSSKKTAGLFSLLFVGLFMLGTAFFVQEKISASTGVYAAYEAQKQTPATATDLPLIIREQTGHKLLIKDGAIYRPQRDFLIELPLFSLPKDTEMTLSVSLTNDEGLYQSRDILVYIAEQD